MPCLVIVFGLSLGLTVIHRLSCSLPFSATQDTDKPEVQPVSEPESQHSCALSCVELGKLEVDYSVGTI